MPEEAERDIDSPMLAYIQFWHLVRRAGVAVVGYLFGIHDGREFLEQPLWIKIGIVVVALIFLYNITHDGAEGPQDRGHQRSAAGLVGRRGLLPVRLLQPRPISRVDKMYWW